MQEDKIKRGGSIRLISFLLIFITLFGFVAVISADDAEPLIPNKIYGNVIFNGDPAPEGTLIEAYIDGVLHSGTGSKDLGVSNGNYFIYVTGNASDDGKPITFKINGNTADHDSVTWVASLLSVTQELNLSAEGLPKNGDINGDEVIDMKDAIYLARHYYEMKYPGSFPDCQIIYANGDIDCDEDIDINDAIYLARHYYEMKYPGSFPDNKNLYPCT